MESGTWRDCRDTPKCSRGLAAAGPFMAGSRVPREFPLHWWLHDGCSVPSGEDLGRRLGRHCDLTDCRRSGPILRETARLRTGCILGSCDVSSYQMYSFLCSDQVLSPALQ